MAWGRAESLTVASIDALHLASVSVKRYDTTNKMDFLKGGIRACMYELAFTVRTCQVRGMWCGFQK